MVVIKLDSQNRKISVNSTGALLTKSKAHPSNDWMFSSFTVYTFRWPISSDYKHSLLFDYIYNACIQPKENTRTELDKSFRQLYVHKQTLPYALIALQTPFGGGCLHFTSLFLDVPKHVDTFSWTRVFYLWQSGRELRTVLYPFRLLFERTWIFISQWIISSRK